MLKSSVMAFGLVALFAAAGFVKADDPNSVPNNVDAPTITLQGDGDADTELTRFYRRGYSSRYRGGFSRSYYPRYSYRNSYSRYSYYPRYSYNYSFRRPYYNNFYSYRRPYYNSFYSYPRYSYGRSFYGGGFYGGGFCPINGDEADVVVAVPLGEIACSPIPKVTEVPFSPGTPSLTPPKVMPRIPDNAQQKSESYKYDGDPTPAPSVAPPTRPAPVNGRLVSIPGQPSESGYTFRAYGEASSTVPATRTSQPVRTAPVATPRPSEFAFPAYGEQSKNGGFATNR